MLSFGGFIFCVLTKNFGKYKTCKLDIIFLGTILQFCLMNYVLYLLSSLVTVAPVKVIKPKYIKSQYFSINVSSCMHISYIFHERFFSFHIFLNVIPSYDCEYN